MKRHLLCSVVLAGIFGCASAAPIPIPVVGARADIDALAGEWQGSYRSPETGRSGSITFSLAVGRDTAFGDVIMIPSRNGPAPEAYDLRTGEPSFVPALLTITFVRAEGGRVRGTLDQYIDPDCRCPVRAVFTGAFTKSNTLEGTFESQSIYSAAVTRGTWIAHRTVAVAAQRPSSAEPH